ncbi:polysaccharide deacetylase family protein [Estrella lausannensis]|uniref:NodB homology domain-containing protein n=1 Tax=Estrella lausannensis TaxID=483423 RepID=A0A0H5DSK1_9BACT|nr:polysaccharide deacetylase family protein [Estrella lausannensis]CRX38759.1 hypothetical protein ELAC_1423 [Estrella lausannensis]
MLLTEDQKALTLEEALALEAFCSFVGLSADLKHLLRPIPVTLREMLFRKEEFQPQEVDQWGNFEYAYSQNAKKGLLWSAEVDRFAKEERVRLTNEGVKLEPLWPKGFRFALVLTHDVDHLDIRETTPLLFRSLKKAALAEDLDSTSRLKLIAKSAAKGLLRKPKRVHDMTGTLEASVRIENKFGVKSSYFFTVFPLTKVSRYDCLYQTKDRVFFEGKSAKLSDVICKLKDAGFDIGLHGSYFSAVEPHLLKEQKERLEHELKMPIVTARQHWLHFKMPLTPSLIADAGITADTTLGYNRNVGYRAGTGYPFFFYDYERQKKISLLEVPMILQDGALIGSNALEYSPKGSLEIVKRFIDDAESLEGCLTLLFHPDIFLKSGMEDLYENIIRYALQKGAWVTDLKSVSSHWEKRLKKLEGRH